MKARSSVLSAGPVLVVGAGPVGTLLAARLLVSGFEVRLLEKRAHRRPGSRAIGVHPPGLEALASVSAAAAVQAAGVRIEGGHAFGAEGRLGTLGLGVDTPVWAVPQPDVEAALEESLERHGGEVERGSELVGLRATARSLVAIVTGSGGVVESPASLVIGCDGRDSRVRELAGISASGGRYQDHYLMADLPCGVTESRYAEVHLHRDGLAESFPLPDGWRRVVVRVTGPHRGPVIGGAVVEPGIARRVCELAQERGAGTFDPEGARMTSAFVAEGWMAERFAAGRVALAGDAAHVVSPIGGQGMNLGWLDALALAAALERVADGSSELESELASYSTSRIRAARTATRRALWNTRMGRPIGRAKAVWRDSLLRAALASTVLSRALAGAFTMRGLA